MVKLHGQACDSLLAHLKSCFSSLWTALQAEAGFPRHFTRLSVNVCLPASKRTHGRLACDFHLLYPQQEIWCVEMRKDSKNVCYMDDSWTKKKKPVSQILPASGIRTPRPTHTPADAGSHFHERTLLQTHGETGPLRDPRPSSLPSPRSPSVSSSLLLHMTFTTV